MRKLRIGSGAGFAGDRIDPAVELVAYGALDFLVCECLAERTIALAQGARHTARHPGYDPMLDDRMRALLPICHANGTRLISNMGAADPIAAAQRVATIARDLGIQGLRIAAVTGDDVLDKLRADHPLQDGFGVLSNVPRVLSANAYMGISGILQALQADADIIVTGRVADPSLFLAPMVHHFGWRTDDWTMLGKGTAIGHLLECAGQLTGGYFADPGIKHVDGLARLGFPLAEVDQSGDAVLTKVPGSGGRLDRLTCTEQLLYELHDPSRYLTPDVTADFSSVFFEEVGPDRVWMTGANGRAAPEYLKLLVGYIDSYVGEGQMSYAGPGALARAKLALEIVAERLEMSDATFSEVRLDLIGQNAIARHPATGSMAEPAETRIRVIARAQDFDRAKLVGREVEALYTNGPAGGGGAFGKVQEVVAVTSGLIARSAAKAEIHLIDIGARAVRANAASATLAHAAEHPVG